MYASSVYRTAYGDSNPKQYRFPVGFDTSSTHRTVHGQLKDNSNPAFKFVYYNDLVEEYEACDIELQKTLIKELGSKTRDGDHRKVSNQYIGNLTSGCIRDFFEPIGKGLELVFGEKPSPGFICGIKDAMLEDDKPFPGSCCLDAPFELDGDNWGHAVSRTANMICQSNKKPYLTLCPPARFNMYIVQVHS